MNTSHPHAARNRALALAALTATTLLWAGNLIAGGIAVAGIDPISLTFVRWLPAAPVLLIIAAVVERPNWRKVMRHSGRLLLMSALGMVGFALTIYEGLRTTTAVVAALIGATEPILIALLAAVLLRERLSPRIVVGLAISLAGVLLVISRGSIENLIVNGLVIGDLWVLISVGCWVAYTLLGRRSGDLPSLTSLGVQALFAVLILLPLLALNGGLQLPNDPLTWWSAAYISVFPSIVAYLFWDYGIRRVPAAVAGISLNMISVFTVLIAFILGQVITRAELIGGALILFGVLLATALKRKGDRIEQSATEEIPDSQGNADDAPAVAQPTIPDN